MTGDVPPTEIVLIYIENFQLRVKTAEKMSTALETVCQVDPAAFCIVSGYVRKNLVDRYSRQLSSDGALADQDTMRKLMDLTSGDTWFHDGQSLNVLDLFEDNLDELPESRIEELIAAMKSHLKDREEES